MSVAVHPRRSFRALVRAAALAALLALRAGAAFAAPDGALDATFDGDGKAAIVVGSRARGMAVAAQPDGKVVVAGSTEMPTAADPSNVAFAVARRNADGTADGSFGPLSTGATTVEFDLGGPGRRQDGASAVALQPDGKILVCGYASVPSNGQRRLAIARLTSLGALDPTFGGGDGKVSFAVTGEGGVAAGRSCSVLVRRNGKILLTPVTDSGTNVLLQLGSDGELDPAFGNAGFSEAWDCGVPPCGVFARTLEMPDGTLLTVGADEDEVVLSRFLADGRFDSGFGGAGRAFFAPPGIAAGNLAVVDMALDPSGKPIVLAFDTSAFAQGLPAPTVLLRLRGDQRDPTFGSGGWASFAFAPSPDAIAYPVALVVQPDGKPVLAGTTNDGGDFNLVATRRTSNGGAIDGSFSGGWRSIAFDLGETMIDGAEAVSLSAGRTVVAGYTWTDGGSTGFSGTAMAVARLDNALLWSDGFESGSSRSWASSAP